MRRRQKLKKKKNEDELWSHESIILKPLSDNIEFQDIILEEDELSSLKVIGVFECVIL